MNRKSYCRDLAKKNGESPGYPVHCLYEKRIKHEISWKQGFFESVGQVAQNVVKQNNDLGGSL